MIPVAINIDKKPVVLNLYALPSVSTVFQALKRSTFKHPSLNAENLILS